MGIYVGGFRRDKLREFDRLRKIEENHSAGESSAKQDGFGNQPRAEPQGDAGPGSPGFP